MYDILTPEQMRMAELASVRLGVGLGELMDNAGEALGEHILRRAEKLMKRNVLFLVGSGNNGGDGFVAAGYLADAGILPTIVLCCGEPKTELAKNAAAKAAGRCRICSRTEQSAAEAVNSADIIIDCVFGTGFHGDIEGELSEFLAVINNVSAYKIACDVPSGVNSLNGQVSQNTFAADETITFHRGKLGLYLAPAKDFCGKVTVADIGIPNGWEKDMGTDIAKAAAEQAAAMLPPRPENGHKGTFGKCALVCGSQKYPGAAVISAMSAMRSGVGIVNLCTPASVISRMGQRIPECTFTALTADEDGFISAENINTILTQLEVSQAAVIGCGLGKNKSTVELVQKIVQQAKCPLIIDADGINCLSEHIDVLKDKQTEIILTPHIGELARLCGVDTKYALDDVLGYAHSIAKKYGVTVHAKSAQTLTVTADKCFITDFGCSALSKGGSGDMLAGLIGSLTAQGASPVDACVLADYIMGSSAKRLCESRSPRGVVATDIISEFPFAFYEAEKLAD